MKIGSKSKVALIVAGVFLACGAVWAQTAIPAGTNGAGIGTARGFGSDVSVTITITNGRITDAIVEGPNETPEYGFRILMPAAEEIKRINSSEIAIDGYAGATMTANAIRNAARQAILMAIRGRP